MHANNGSSTSNKNGHRTRTRPRRAGAGGGGLAVAGAAAARASLPSVRDVVYVLFKHQKKAACVAAGVLAVTFAAATLVSSKYTSEAQLLVRIGRESMPTATVANAPGAMPMLDRMTEVNSEAQIVRSNGVIQRTVDRVGVEDLLGEAPSADAVQLAAQKARAARLLASRVEVRTEPLSAILRVSYEAKSPTQARDVVRAYVDSYLDHRAAIYSGGAAGGLFDGLTKDSQARLLSIEQQIKALKDQTGVSDVDAQKTILLARVAALQTSLDTANAQLTSTIGRIGALEEQRDQTPREVILSSTKNDAQGVTTTAENELNKLRAELDARSATFLPTSPTILQLKDQVAAAERRLASFGDAKDPRVVGMNPTWSELDRQLATERTNLDGLDAQVQTLSRELKNAKQGQATINEVELQMGQLARERGMLVEQLRKLVEGRDFSSIDQAMGKDKVGSVVTSQAATLPTSPTSPNRPLLLLFGLLAAGVCGAGTAALAEALDGNVGKPLDLKRLGFKRVISIPLLAMDDADDHVPAAADAQALRELADRDESLPSGSAPDVLAAAPRPAGSARGHLLDRARPVAAVRFGDTPVSYPTRDEVAAGKAAAVGTKPAIAGASTAVGQPATSPTRELATMRLAASKPALNPRFLEACRSAVERFILSPVATGEMAMPRSIAIVSITPGQGATTFATHFGAALAADALDDHGTPARALVVDANFERPGVGRILDTHVPPAASGVSAIRATAIPRLDVLEAATVADAGRRDGRWADVVAEALEGTNHLVIVDLPCMAESEAAARLAGACDGAILIVEAGNANREVVRQAGHRLAESGVKLLGAVLNGREYPIPDALYRWI